MVTACARQAGSPRATAARRVTAERVEPRDLDPQQLAAVLGLPCEQALFAFHGDHVGDQTPSGEQRPPACLEHGRFVNAATDEHGMRSRQIGEASGARACTTVSSGVPRLSALRAMVAQRACVLLDGDRLGAVCGPQPLDGNCAAAGADIPQTLSRKRSQPARVVARTSRLVIMPSDPE